MSKIQDYFNQRQAESKAFWTKALSGPVQRSSPEEMMQQVRQRQAAAPAADLVPPRDLAAEQAELRDLLGALPWLKLRKVADELGLPASTFDAYLADPLAVRYRPLRDPIHADTLWALLRDTAAYIQISLPEAFQKPVPPLPS